MKHKCFAVFDQKAKAYLTPFFLHNSGMALRAFGDCVNDSQHQFGKHPEDYVLFEVATFDDEDAHWDVPSSPVLLVSGLQLIEVKQ